MDARGEMDPAPVKDRATVERTSDRELVVTRLIRGPARLVFEAWTRPELFQRWWVPRSTGMRMLSCEADVRTGGTYRLVMSHDAFPAPMEFFGKYLEVTPHSRLVWTNDEAGEGGPITTVTFEDRGGRTLQVMHELYPSKEALDAAMASGEKACIDETCGQLEELLATLSASAAPS
jgi:uncharacterized protein YndB with AHSA1/START domain